MTNSSGKITIQATREATPSAAKNQNKTKQNYIPLKKNTHTTAFGRLLIHSLSISLSKTSCELDYIGPTKSYNQVVPAAIHHKLKLYIRSRSRSRGHKKAG